MSNRVLFQFDNANPNRPDRSAKNALDYAIEAAGGAALPGVLGLIQAVATTWTQPMSGPKWFQVARCTLSSIGAVREWDKRRKPDQGEDRDDQWETYKTQNKLVIAEDLQGVKGLVYAYLRRGDSYTDAVLKPANYIVRNFQCGLSAVFASEEDVKRCDSGRNAPLEVAYRPKAEAQVKRIFQQAVWRAHDNGLDFSQPAGDRYGNEEGFYLGSLTPPSDYVNSPENSEATTSLNAMAKRCNLFIPAGIPRRILFIGPPGTGKTTMARRLASLIGDGRTLRLDPNALLSTSSHVISRMVRLLAPTVLMIDDLDRYEQYGSMLGLLEDLSFVPLILGSVNSLEGVDPALLRPGRFDEVVRIGLPDEPWRKNIIQHYMKLFGLEGSAECSAETLAAATAEFAPAELRELTVVLSKVGPELTTFELERLRQQKMLYSQDVVDKFLADH